MVNARRQVVKVRHECEIAIKCYKDTQTSRRPFFDKGLFNGINGFPGGLSVGVEGIIAADGRILHDFNVRVRRGNFV